LQNLAGFFFSGGMAGQPGSSPVLAEHARYNGARSMRAVGAESRPPCQCEKGSLLARPSRLFNLQDSVGRKMVGVRGAAFEWNCAEWSSF
jgi:hypothetical protein